MDVTRLTTLEGNKIPHPEETTPFDVPAQIRFLTRQLSPEQLKLFNVSSAKLPQNQRLRALRHLISQN